jgi:hypothetical protein
MTILTKYQPIITTVLVKSILIYAILIFTIYNGKVHATINDESSSSDTFSPSVGMQEFDDAESDWSKQNLGTASESISKKLIKNLTGSEIGDIDSVNYFSNGKYLNVSFWLTHPFEEKPLRHIPSYNVLIDADSDPLTGGNQGIDYRVRVPWDNNTKTWQMIIEKVSNSEKTKIIFQDNNYTGFFNKDDSIPNLFQIDSWYPTHSCCYVSIPIDLHLLNYPKQFSFVFQLMDSFYDSTNGIREPLFMVDATSRMGIPPPQFFISAENNSVEVKAGEKVEILLNLNSTSFLPSYVSLSVGKVDDMILKMNPPSLFISPKSTGSTILTIDTFSNAKQGPQILELTANVYFPTVNNMNQYSFQEPRLDMIQPYNMIVTVTAPPTFDEKFSAFWDVYGSAINLIAGGFVGGLSGWFFARMERNREVKK